MPIVKLTEENTHRILRRWLLGASGVDIARDLGMHKQTVQVWLRHNTSAMDAWRRAQHLFPGLGWASDNEVARNAGVSGSAVSSRRRTLGLRPRDGRCLLTVGHHSIDLPPEVGDMLAKQKEPAAFVARLLTEVAGGDS